MFAVCDFRQGIGMFVVSIVLSTLYDSITSDYYDSSSFFHDLPRCLEFFS